MKTKLKSGEKAVRLIFVFLLAVQTAAAVFLCDQKLDYHIDEIYSYILSNSYDADRISNDPDVLNQWIDGERLKEFVTVQPGERFAYGHVYLNNSFDAHPPLYYYMLHTLCSLFPDSFSKWYGVGLNIFLFVLTQIVIFSAAKLLFGKDSIWALLPSAVFGGTHAMLSSVLFIRMYMLVTLLTAVYSYVHLLMYKRKTVYPLLCFVITFLGVYTQYLFAFFAFFMTAAFCFFLFSQRSWKKLILYSVSVLAGVTLVFLVYPAAFQQIGGSETNNVGNEVAGHFTDFSNLSGSILSLLRETIYGTLKGLFDARLPVLVVGIVTVVAAILRKDGESCAKPAADDLRIIGVGLLVSILTFCTVAHVIGKYVYFRYVYNLFPLFSVIGVYAVYRCVLLIPLNRRVLAAGSLCIWLLGTVYLAVRRDNEYLFQNEYAHIRDNIAMCEGKPLVAVGAYETYFPTGNFTFLSSCRDLYLASEDPSLFFDDVIDGKDVSNGVVVMVLTDQYWSDGYDGAELMDRIMDHSDTLTKYTEIGSSDYSTYYLAEK